jgi:hypothetical protein
MEFRQDHKLIYLFGLRVGLSENRFAFFGPMPWREFRKLQGR